VECDCRLIKVVWIAAAVILRVSLRNFYKFQPIEIIEIKIQFLAKSLYDCGPKKARKNGETICTRHGQPCLQRKIHNLFYFIV
jgi:hypothetical protein